MNMTAEADTETSGGQSVGGRQMSDNHKAALAEGRSQGNTVRSYLEALREHKPKRGRKRTPETVSRQLAAVERDLEAGPAPIKELELLQRRRDLERELAGFSEGNELLVLEAAFVEIAAAYGERKGIEYATWREFGVSASVLASAGITRATKA